jgi:hypothetical protein
MQADLQAELDSLRGQLHFFSHFRRTHKIAAWVPATKTEAALYRRLTEVQEEILRQDDLKSTKPRLGE